MSVINTNKSVNLYAGSHYVETTTNSGYIITGCKRKQGSESGYSVIAFDDTNSTQVPQNSGVLNDTSSQNKKYTSARTDVFTLNQTNDPVNFQIITEPRRYTVVYNRNHSNNDSTVLNKYTDICPLRPTEDSTATPPVEGIDRTDKTVNDVTYGYHANALTFASTLWSTPQNKHFIHWNTVRDDSGTTFDETDDLSVLTQDINLYAIYAEDVQYTVNVHFDSVEVDQNNITIA